ncbi:MAG: DNA cytosine methyltransferase [Treponema sp.]|nr:DNA cytosine methyltransferase [Treponema sp.]
MILSKKLSFIDLFAGAGGLSEGVIAYISCFPDCLTDGAPHGVKTENNHRLATSEKVVDAMGSVGGIVNPHFRRGYFKRLESDFYKNKKGQIIFVHETVVNTQAKTLE